MQFASLQQVPQQNVHLLPEQLTLALLYLQLTAIPLLQDVDRFDRTSLVSSGDVSICDSEGAAAV